MKGGGGYKLIQIQGDWGTQYHMLAVVHGREAILKRKIPIPVSWSPEAGNYKITVDFQLGKFTGKTITQLILLLCDQ